MSFDVGKFHNDLLRNYNCSKALDILKDNCELSTIGKALHRLISSYHHIGSQNAYSPLRLCGQFPRTQVLFRHNKHTSNPHKPLGLHTEPFVAMPNCICVSWLNPSRNLIDVILSFGWRLLQNERDNRQAFLHYIWHGKQGLLAFFGHIHFFLLGLFLLPYNHSNILGIKYQLAEGV